MPQHIPWGYGYDRVTAMVIDPERLYVYWEVTDDAVAAARAGLGPAGANAWLNLRVYDISGRLFDGTNAHSYFDHRVERHDRQWFFVINKPTSSAMRRGGPEVRRGLLRQDRPLGARRVSAPRADARRPRRVADRARERRDPGAPPRRGRATARRPAGTAARRRAPPAADPAGPGGETPELGRLDRALRRIPGARRQPRRRPSLGVAGAERRRVDRRREADRVGRAAPADRVGIGTVHLPDRGPLVGGGGSRQRRDLGADRERPRARRLRPLAGGHPRARRARRAAGARHLGVQAPGGGLRRLRAVRRRSRLEKVSRARQLGVDVARGQRAFLARLERAPARGRQRAVDARRQRDAARRLQRADVRRRQRAAAARRQRDDVRGRQRADDARGERAHLRGRQRADDDGRQRARARRRQRIPLRRRQRADRRGAQRGTRGSVHLPEGRGE